MPKATRKALELISFTEELNQERLIVKGLPASSYELLIDGRVVGVYTARALAVGINLATNEKTPQHEQAAALAAKVGRRFRRQVELRTLAHVWHSALSRELKDRSDLEKSRQILARRLESNKGKSWYKALAERYERYLKLHPREAAIRAEIAALGQEIKKASTARQHAYQLRRQRD